MEKCDKCGLCLNYMSLVWARAGIKGDPYEFHTSFKNNGLMAGTGMGEVWGCHAVCENYGGEKQYTFTTIAPTKYLNKQYNPKLPYTQNAIADLKLFGEAIGYLYSEYLYVVESGKKSDTPHLHIHILGIARNSKKTKDGLRSKWDQFMGKHMKRAMEWKSDDYDLRQYRKTEAMPSYDDWVAEKKSYMVNEYKGTHENFEVLMPTPKGRGVSTAEL